MPIAGIVLVALPEPTGPAVASEPRSAMSRTRLTAAPLVFSSISDDETYVIAMGSFPRFCFKDQGFTWSPTSLAPGRLFYPSLHPDHALPIAASTCF